MSAKDANTRAESARKRGGTALSFPAHGDRWAAAGLRLVLPPIERLDVDCLALIGTAAEGLTPAPTTD
jgi:hypothetical protein